MSKAPIRAEALAEAIRMLPDPESGPSTVRIPIEPIRRLTTDPLPQGDAISESTFVVFRREVYSNGRTRWREYVLDI